MPHAPPHGQALADGRYSLTARLGEGGMAGVYRAWDERMRVDRAVKVMLPEFARRKKLRLRFEREAHTMARLEHPNLIRVYDVGTQARVPYLVMELITGGTLMDWVTRNGAMPPRQAVGAIAQLCLGVAAAHDAGIVHRDIKPHNVLISQAGVCKLADFGIAHVEEDSLTRTGSAMGTIGYMPPEQRKDAKSVDARCDVFSVAATLWFLLKNQTVLDVFLVGDDPRLLQGIPEVLHPVICRAVSYSREGRHESILAFRDELLLAAESLPPEPPGPPLAAPEPTTPELEADWFSELAPLFDESFIATPEPVDYRADLRPPTNQGGKKLPYFMPTTPLPPASTSRATGTSQRQGDSLPDYVDRQALSQGERSFDLKGAPTPAPVPEALVEASAPLLSRVEIGAVVAVVIALCALGSFIYTHVRLGQTAQASRAAENALFTMLDGEAIVVHDLGSFGVAREALDQRYFTYQDAVESTTRGAAAAELVSALQSASSGLKLDGESSVRATSLKVRIDALVRARDDRDEAMADWRGYATTLRGKLLLVVGIAEAPS